MIIVLLCPCFIHSADSARNLGEDLTHKLSPGQIAEGFNFQLHAETLSSPHVEIGHERNRTIYLR
jgi:hypothetical protein